VVLHRPHRRDRDGSAGDHTGRPAPAYRHGSGDPRLRGLRARAAAPACPCPADWWVPGHGRAGGATAGPRRLDRSCYLAERGLSDRVVPISLGGGPDGPDDLAGFHWLRRPARLVLAALAEVSERNDPRRAVWLLSPRPARAGRLRNLRRHAAQG